MEEIGGWSWQSDADTIRSHKKRRMPRDAHMALASDVFDWGLEQNFQGLLLRGIGKGVVGVHHFI